MTAYIAYDKTALRGTYHSITTVFQTADELTSYSVGSNELKLLGSDTRTPSNVGDAMVGWIVDTSNNTIVAALPADESVTAQRAEIYQLVRNFLDNFDGSRHWNDPTMQQAIYRYARICLVYAKASTTDAQLDKVKTGAQTDPNEFALYINANSWWSGLNGVGFPLFVKPDEATPASVSYPTAETGMPTVQASDITGLNVAEELS